jgi:hypothetical protein
LLTFISEQRTTNVQSTATAARSNANQNLKDHVPPKKMVVRFADVSADSEKRLNDYLMVKVIENTRQMFIFSFCLECNRWYAEEEND